jgi:hypothetical protein
MGGRRVDFGGFLMLLDDAGSNSAHDSSRYLLGLKLSHLKLRG